MALDIKEAEGILGISEMTAGPGDVSLTPLCQLLSLALRSPPSPSVAILVQAAWGVAPDIQEAEGILGISKMVAGPGDVSLGALIRSLGTNISLQKLPSSDVPVPVLEMKMGFVVPIADLVEAMWQFQQHMDGPLVYGSPGVTAPPPPPTEKEAARTLPPRPEPQPVEPNSWETDFLELQRTALDTYRAQTLSGFRRDNHTWHVLDEEALMSITPKVIEKKNLQEEEKSWKKPSDASKELVPRRTLDDRKAEQERRQAAAERDAQARREAAAAEQERRRLEEEAERERRRVQAAARHDARVQRKGLKGKGGGQEATDEWGQGEGEGEAGADNIPATGDDRAVHQQKGNGEMVKGKGTLTPKASPPPPQARARAAPEQKGWQPEERWRSTSEQRAEIRWW